MGAHFYFWIFTLRDIFAATNENMRVTLSRISLILNKYIFKKRKELTSLYDLSKNTYISYK